MYSYIIFISLSFTNDVVVNSRVLHHYTPIYTLYYIMIHVE